MRNTPNVKAERYRLREYSDSSYGNNGAFYIDAFTSGTCGLRVIVSDGGGWDHVSVSLSHRTPTWDEMKFVKELFFKDEECVMQLHPPKSEYVNDNEYCLHMWRPQTHEEIIELEKLDKAYAAILDSYEEKEIPRPPMWMVGVTVKQ